jgi:anti-sigma-K factor RskA
MPVSNLGALNAATEPVPVGAGTWTFAIGGTFAGTVQMQWRSTPAGDWEAISLSSFGGSPANYTAPTGAIAAMGSALEPDAQVRAVMIAYTSGTAAVRVGR